MRLVVVNQERFNKNLIGIFEPLRARNTLDLLPIESNDMRSGVLVLLVLAKIGM
jgi:hypothetical protein